MNAPSLSAAAHDSTSQRSGAPAGTPIDWISHGVRHLERWISRSINVLIGARNQPLLYNMAGFAALGDEMLASCRQGGRALTVAVFDCADLLEVRSIYGSAISRKLTSRIVRKLTAVCGDAGLAARTGPAEFTLVLPGATHEKALAAIQRVLGNPMRIELDAGDSEIVLVPGFLLQTVGGETGSVTQLHADLRRELARLHAQEERRQHHMQRERERHSRPMGISSLPAQAAVSRRVSAQARMDVTRPATLSAS